MGKKSAYTKTMVAGCAVIIGVAALTAFTVGYVIKNVNDQADAAYLDTLSSMHIVHQTESVPDKEPSFVPDEPSVVSEEPSDIPDESSTPVETSEQEVSKPESSKDKNETEPEKPVQDTHSDDDNVIENMNIDLSNCSLNSDGDLVYTVQPGDMLCLIAERFDSSVESIGKINKIEDVNLIYSGQKFVIKPINEDIIKYARIKLK